MDGSILPSGRIDNPTQSFDQFSLPLTYQRGSSTTPPEQRYNRATRMHNPFAPQDHSYDSTNDVNLDYFSFSPQFQPPAEFDPSATSNTASQNTSMNAYVSKRTHQDPSLRPLPWLQLAETSMLRSGASLGSGRPFDSQMPPPALPQRQTQTQGCTHTQAQAQAQAQGHPS